MDEYIKKLLAAAGEAGITAAEVYLASSDRFRAMCQQGVINNYTVNSTRGLSLRGIYNGRMGYAGTEAFDDESIAQLVSGVIQSTTISEDDSVQEIYPGDKEYPDVDNYAPELDSVTPEEKLEYIREAEKTLLACDPRIAAATYNMISTASGTVRIVNSYGLDLQMRDNVFVSYINALARDNGQSAGESAMCVGRTFRKEEAVRTAKEAAEKTLFMLGAEPVKSGVYRTIFDPYAMGDLLGVFSGIFSSENAQQNMSLLAGREGEKIASDVVTLVDDPLLKGGFESRAFDDEGVACRTLNVVEDGVLKTLLYNLKTARKAGVKSTGSARKAGYAAPVRVAPSNFFFKPGTKSLDELMQDVGEGLVITEVGGLHAGANPMSGDFSLIAEGYTVHEGKKDRPVEQITVAGNFYELLKSIRAVGCDLVFPGGGIGSPSVDVGELRVSGK